MPQKPYHHHNLRAQLIEAGICLMNEQGYKHLSLRGIAAACGVSHAAPYRHFKDKQQLLKAMQQHVEKEFAQILQDAVRRSEDAGAAHPMLEFGKAYVVFFARHPQYYDFFVRRGGIHIHLCPHTGVAESNYAPFLIFEEQAQKHLAGLQLAGGAYIAALLRLWATVHGLAGMATMPGLHYEGDWGALTEAVLKGVSACA